MKVPTGPQLIYIYPNISVATEENIVNGVTYNPQAVATQIVALTTGELDEMIVVNSLRSIKK